MFLVTALVLSLGPVCQSLHYTIDRSFYQTTPEVCAKLTKAGRICHDFGVIQKGDCVFGQSIQDAYEQLKGDLMPNWPLNYGFEEVFNHNTFFLSSFLRWWYGALQVSPDFSKRVLDYLDVRYFLGKDPGPGFALLPGNPSPDPVWVNPSPLPKWGSIQRALPALDWDRDMNWASMNHFHFRRDCFVNDPAIAGPYEHREVALKALSPNRLMLEVGGRGKALLVSSETAYPGWEAWTGKKAKNLEVVNYGFRGVVLADGEKNIDMEYRPTTFRMGVFLSLLVAGLWAALALKMGWDNFARV